MILWHMTYRSEFFVWLNLSWLVDDHAAALRYACKVLDAMYGRVVEKHTQVGESVCMGRCNHEVQRQASPSKLSNWGKQPT